VPFGRFDAYIPELTSISLRRITGVTIKRGRSSVNLYIRYDAEARALAISVDGISWHSALSTVSDVTDGLLQTASGEWLCLDVDVSELPLVTTDELVMVTDLWDTLLPPVWLDSDNQDSVLHHFAVLKNVGDNSETVRVKSLSAIGTAVVASTYTDGDGYIDLENIDGLPGRDFWLYLDTSSADVRYVTQRAGTRCYLTDTSHWQEVAFDGGSEAPTVGQTIEAGSLSGTLRACYVTSGSWAAGTAAGVMIISDSDGLFENNETLIQDSVSIAEVSGNGSYAIRGLARQNTWAAGESVQWYPPFDVLLVDPDSTGEFEAVMGSQSPVTKAFSVWTPETDGYTGEEVSAFGPGDIVGVIFRRFLLADMVGSLSIMDELAFGF